MSKKNLVKTNHCAPVGSTSIPSQFHSVIQLKRSTSSIFEVRSSSNNHNNNSSGSHVSKKPEFNLSRFLVTNKKKTAVVSSILHFRISTFDFLCFELSLSCSDREKHKKRRDEFNFTFYIFNFRFSLSCFKLSLSCVDSRWKTKKGRGEFNFTFYFLHFRILSFEFWLSISFVLLWALSWVYSSFLVTKRLWWCFQFYVNFL